MFKQLNAKYGKYSCLGNHDYSDGDDGNRIINAYSKSGIRILVNESDEIKIGNAEINLAGVDDFTLGNQNLKKLSKISKNAKNQYFWPIIP